jgi:hypothetical protein
MCTNTNINPNTNPHTAGRVSRMPGCTPGWTAGWTGWEDGLGGWTGSTEGGVDWQGGRLGGQLGGGRLGGQLGGRAGSRLSGILRSTSSPGFSGKLMIKRCLMSPTILNICMVVQHALRLKFRRILLILRLAPNNPQNLPKASKDIHCWLLAPNLISRQLWKCKLFVPSQFLIFPESGDLRGASYVFATISLTCCPSW